MGVRVFVGNIPHDATEADLQDEFNKYNPARIWIARKPPGFAFIEFDDSRDADDAVRKLDGVHGWKVELSRNSGPRERRDGGDGRCYQCGEPGHFARECRNGGGGGSRGGDRYDRRDDRRDDRYDRRNDRYDRRDDRRDDRYERRRSRSPPRRRSPSGSPRRRPSPSPSPARRYSRSPSR